MITGHVTELSQYAVLGKNFETAARFVESLKPDDVTAGHYDIDGEKVFANVVDRELHETPTQWERHQRYADIHLILEGSEIIGCCPLARFKQAVPVDPETDNAMLDGAEGTMADLETGEFLIALPQDVHLPNCPGKRGPHCKKMILKVLVEE